MKFLLVLAVLAAASSAVPNFPTTFQADCKIGIVYSLGNTTKYTAKETLATDSAKNITVRCTLYDGISTSFCSLKDYSKKALYSYTRDSLGEFGNCTTGPIPANAFKYMYDWAWISDSTYSGVTEFPYCGISAQTWGLSYEDKITFKMGVSDKKSSQSWPVAMMIKSVSEDGYFEKHICYEKFTTTVDPGLFTVPQNCKETTRHPDKKLLGLNGYFERPM